MHTWKLCALALLVSPCLAQAQEAKEADQAQEAKKGDQAQEAKEADQAQEGKKGDGYPRRLTGENLTFHFKGNWSVNGATSRSMPITFIHNSNGAVRFRTPTSSRAPDGVGKRYFKEEDNLVCLYMETTSWRGLEGCYRLVENTPGTFSMVRGNFRIDYRR